MKAPSHKRANDASQGLTGVTKEIDGIVAEVADGNGHLHPALAEMAHTLVAGTEALRSVAGLFAPIAERLRTVLQNAAPSLLAIARAVEGMPERTAQALRTLARNGWYLDPGMLPREVFDRAAEFERSAVGDAHQKLCQHFDSRLDEIESSLCRLVPRRAKFIRSALAAHRRAEFAAAIPLLLTQADGMCWDVTREQLYARERNSDRPRVAARLRMLDGTNLRASVVVALIEPAPIAANARERRSLRNILNRHAVLHGESLDYDTSLNSCRALSLITYVSWALRQEDFMVDDKPQGQRRPGPAP